MPKKLLSATLATACVIAATATAQTWEENLAAGAATTEQNHLNVPFTQMKNMKTAFSSPGNWPIFENRGPLDRSPADKPSKVLVMGSGDPNPNPYRYGPALAVIVNDYPYFIDAGEGWWRALGKSVQSQDAMDLATIMNVPNIKYMFLTHLHEDHTVGLPSFILNPFKFGSNLAVVDKKVYGPAGVDEMMASINDAWRIDRNEMAQGSTVQKFDGATAVGVPVWPHVDVNGRKIFEDDNVLVEAFPTAHGFLENTHAYRFTTKPDGRVLVFGGDGHYSEGLVNASKDADLLFVEGITRKNIKFAPWGGQSEEEKVKVIGAYHMFPSDMKKLQDDSGVKGIVMVHVQNYNSPEDFERLSVLQEMIDEGVVNILQASDGDLY
ncbi:MBL fold metallo-hydrolase [uncultured Ruegeria sp.]|uniref:MBL fold metallo-hydrolase n=1 Tax=uncultured Ruegeria sp. TaxID=259304 RepID=UPI00261D9912|nr:MBL fold metallo-hydrolase [uncultured Ruegeria sp.]